MSHPDDVEIVLAPGRRLQFNSGILTRNSTLFASLLTERHAAKLNHRARSAGIKLRWMVALTRGPSDEEPAGHLELVELAPTSHPFTHPTGLLTNENGLVPSTRTLLDNYTLLLTSFTTHDLPLADDNITSALEHSIALVELAGYLGCIPAISAPIALALAKHGQSLFRAIQAMPWGWLDLGCRIRSEMIVKEAVIHCAGNWKKISAQRDPNVLERLRNLYGENGADDGRRLVTLIQRLHRQLVVRGKTLELEISSLYPGNMKTPGDRVPVKRDEYAKDVLVWMALSFFRHWFAQQIITGKGAAGVDAGFALYTQLGKAGDAYMDRRVMEQFHAEVPMTKKAFNILENHVLEIKELMKGVVYDGSEEGQRMLESRCQLDVKRFPVDYLTCIEVHKEDMPWVQREMERARPRKQEKQAWGVGKGTKRVGDEMERGRREKAERKRVEKEMEEMETDDEERDDEERYGGDEEIDAGGKRKKKARYTSA